MKIDQLLYFIETAKLEHVGRASKVLGVSASAISHSIASLEEELGLELFDRKGKAIYITAKGTELLNKGEKLARQFQDLQDEMGKAGAQVGHYRLAGTHGLASSLLAPVWAKLSGINPKISIDLLSMRSADVVAGVLSRQVDFGVCLSPQKHPDLVSEKIKEGKLVLIVAQNHPVLTQKRLSISEISGYPAVLPKALQGIDVCEMDPLFKRLGIKVNVQAVVDNYEVMLQLVAKSKAWGFIPDHFITNESQVKVLGRNKDWHSSYQVCVICRKDRHVPHIFTKITREMRYHCFQ